MIGNKTVITLVTVILVVLVVVVIRRSPFIVRPLLRATSFNRSTNTLLLERTVQQRNDLSRQLNLLQVRRYYVKYILNYIKQELDVSTTDTICGHSFVFRFLPVIVNNVFFTLAFDRFTSIDYRCIEVNIMAKSSSHIYTLSTFVRLLCMQIDLVSYRHGIS